MSGKRPEAGGDAVTVRPPRVEAVLGSSVDQLTVGHLTAAVAGRIPLRRRTHPSQQSTHLYEWADWHGLLAEPAAAKA